MKLILVRHGQTEENKKKIWQGQSEGTLSEEGEEQAKKLARALEKEDISFVYCSDLKRAKNTLKPLLKNRKLPVEYVKELRERKLGVLEGANSEQVKEYVTKNKVDFETCNFETGETLYEAKDRIAKFYETLSGKHEEDTILLVTHGGIVAYTILHLFNHPPEKFKEFIPDNTGITRIEIKKGKPKLLTFNDTSHL